MLAHVPPQDCDFKAAAESLAERGMLAGGGGRGKSTAGINRRKQGGEEYLAQVGALTVPEHTRRQRSGTGRVLSQVGGQQASVDACCCSGH